MKKLIILASLVLTGYMACGQGYLTFGNRNTVSTPAIDARVLNQDGVTPVWGAAFQAQLYWSTTQNGTYTAAGTAVPFRGTSAASTTAGYINSSTVTIAGQPGGTQLWVQMRAWDTAVGAAYSDAVTKGYGYGFSAPLQVTLAGSPAPPTDMIGLQGFSLVAVPEPSTIALGLLGAAGLFLRRRK